MATTPPATNAAVLRDRLSTTAAAELLGIKGEQFRRLAEKLGLKPIGTYKNPHYRSGPPCPLWPTDVVQSLVGGSDLAALLERSRRQREAKQAAPGRRAEALAARHQDYREAVPKAAEALFNLNRYAKHASCQRDHQQEIYALKNHFVRVLCELGMAQEAKRHVVRRAGLVCHSCAGSGCGEGQESDCDRCVGTGWYRWPEELVFIAFRFRVGEKTYSWHQPAELVTWEVEFSETPEEWVPEREEKPIAMARTKFSQAKSLLQFVVTRHKSAVKRRRKKG